MPIRTADLQRRSAQIGEIRNGTSVAVAGKGYRKPVRLETFRFTTPSERTAAAVAELYGGKVTPWTQQKGKFEVTTGRAALDVWVPPRLLVVDANMELWDGPRRKRRCDGETMIFPSAQPCQCPQPDDPDDPVSVQAARDKRLALAGMRPPQACKPLTRFNVTLPDLPGVGMWKLASGSEFAARETADAGDIMQIAREGGKYVPAVLLITWRNRISDGSPYPVVVLHIDMSLRQIANNALPGGGEAGLLAQLRSGPAALAGGSVPALPAGCRPPGPPAAAADSDEPAGAGVAPDPDAHAVNCDLERGFCVAGCPALAAARAAAGAEPDDGEITAQVIASAAMAATTTAQVNGLARQAELRKVLGHSVNTSGEGEPEAHERLHDFLQVRWYQVQGRAVPDKTAAS